MKRTMYFQRDYLFILIILFIYSYHTPVSLYVHFCRFFNNNFLLSIVKNFADFISFFLVSIYVEFCRILDDCSLYQIYEQICRLFFVIVCCINLCTTLQNS